jgi:hypothetical protein
LCIGGTVAGAGYAQTNIDATQREQRYGLA